MWITFLKLDDFGTFDFTYDGVGPISLSGMTSQMVSYVLPGNTLTIGVSLAPGSMGTMAESYQVKLEVHHVPEPAALALFGVSLAGLGAARRRRRNR